MAFFIAELLAVAEPPKLVIADELVWYVSGATLKTPLEEAQATSVHEKTAKMKNRVMEHPFCLPHDGFDRARLDLAGHGVESTPTATLSLCLSRF